MKNALWILLGTLVIYLGALVAFDLNLNETKIPITGQSLAVLVVGFLLGRENGFLAVFVYLLLGIIGLPVFAKGASGPEVFTKGSGGFLYGFLFASYLIGVISESEKSKNFGICLGAMAMGTAVILFFGIGHLTYLYGFEKALEYGLYPFWKGAVVKIIIGGIIVYGISRLVKLPVGNTALSNATL